MPDSDPPRLFEMAAEASRPSQPEAEKRHLKLIEPDNQLGLRDEVEQVLEAPDGLPARRIRPHSSSKAWMVGRDLAIVAKAMNRKWFNLHYLELQAGPGLLLDEETRGYVEGSPLQALNLNPPFDAYTLAEKSERLVDALRVRVGVRPNTRILCGDANDPAHLERIAAGISERDLVIAYLDPEGLELEFATVRFLAGQFPHIDFLINLPVSGIHRALAARPDDDEILARVEAALDHPRPAELLTGDPPQAIRDWHARRLEDLGLEHITRRTVRVQANNSPLYDVVLASRHPKAVELFAKANRQDRFGQSSMF
jgi:three-Cys-motif partner protein